ncbi:hypothetical protein FisN_2Hh066 [Fistulifera solaris]|jgi:hypothetical protein|uniref:Uncharacterized protein n=1 Tax=Fistulifera solaris TaxID=1519565 RepID=A0A1Z5KPA6_FISSO|nr:hypothetical protein FisN_2Hh066 [Fistulifera solaris]|eukprot:GAX28109.1 hypothetical protein FisN_2Hh066 [Fistulifera solaris]
MISLLLDHRSFDSVQIVNDNARLPARSETLSVPPVRRRRNRDAWKQRRSSSCSDLQQSQHQQQPLHLNHSWLDLKTTSRPHYTNRWDTNCPQGLMAPQPRCVYDSSPPKKPVRRMNSFEPGRDTARLLEQALLITNHCASCEF